MEPWPLDPHHLRFVYEEGLESVPSMCVVLGYPGFWLREPALAADWVKMLHAEHYFEMHRPLPVDGTIRSTHKLIAVTDKGPDKGALVYLEKRLTDGTRELQHRAGARQLKIHSS